MGGSSWGSAGGSRLELKERARLGGEVWKAEEDLEGLGENVPLPEWTSRRDGERPCGRGAWEGSGTAGSSAFMLLCGVLVDPRGCWDACPSARHPCGHLVLGPLAGARGGGRVGSNVSLCSPEERWSSYCLSSLAAQNICTSKLHCSAAPGQADLTGSLGSTSCCSLLRALSSGWSTPLLPAPVCNPNKAVFTVDAKTTEVRASGCDPAAAWGLWPQLAASDGRPSVPVQLGERPGLPLQRRER